MSAQRTPILAGNWKLFKTGPEGAVFVKELAARLGLAAGSGPATGAGAGPGSGASAGPEAAPEVEIVVAPPFTSLYQVAQACKGTPLAASAQDCYWEEKGAFTGEVAPHMILDAGARWVIVGHSERRQFFGESDETVARKARAAVDAGLIPIVCVGEIEAQRLAGETKQVLKTQVSGGLSLLTPEEVAGIAIAYEPVWAIGTGRTATPEVAQEACAYVRSLVSELYGAEAAARVRVLYGGSVKADNAAQLMKQSDIDGGLVGGASLEVESFAGIIEQSRS